MHCPRAAFLLSSLPSLAACAGCAVLFAAQSKTMRYIGVSRGVQQSLRLHLARRPSETHFFKVGILYAAAVLLSFVRLVGTAPTLFGNVVLGLDHPLQS